MTIAVGLVLVSHSGNLAKGAAEVAAQMAPDVPIYAAGGTDDNRIGTSFDRVMEMVERVQEAGAEAVVLSDLGSALLTAESVAEVLDGGVTIVDAPFVEGAVAAAVAAQTGSSASQVAAAARTAIDAFAGGPADAADSADDTDHPGGDSAATDSTADTAAPATPAPAAAEATDDHEASSDVLERTVTLRNSLGLHARPAAQVARIVADHDAEVTINETPAASVLALMGLGLTGGAEATLRASGPQAGDVLTRLEEEFENGFGED
ncbi:dihydroxyacetone kinase phosphoryl donor subunit DhaM [Pseudactinotalea sp. HY160]|uniref:dihydroxyacetone kinase phosphoryl donor subunit DhaM n=1 Tax=Pseudactinotalea sp. HY160 TaxID=2654490 RepID=UPI00351BBE20